jgi:two-component system phosphate regulon response regulator PhoB
MPSQAKPKLLLVDDEKLLLDMYSISLLKAGFDVIISTSSEQALTMLKNGYVPEAILFDINMPEHSGYEFLEQVALFPALKNTLKIALTNEGQDAGIERLKELGADAHLIKALYTPSQLTHAVQEMLSNRSGVQNKPETSH